MKEVTEKSYDISVVFMDGGVINVNRSTKVALEHIIHDLLHSIYERKSKKEHIDTVTIKFLRP